MLTKEDVHYRKGNLAEHCGNCVMFRYPRNCTLVEGNIRQSDVCDRWESLNVPYKVEKRGDEWVVINTQTDQVKAHHATQEDADGQVRLLHMLEKERDNNG